MAGKASKPMRVTTAPTIPVAVAKSAQVTSAATAIEPGMRRSGTVAPACVHQCEHSGEIEQRVQRELDRRLAPRPPAAEEEVGAHVAVARQRIGAGHEEE